MRSYPLTPTQLGIFVNSLRAGGGLVEIEQIVCRLHEHVDPARLRAAWAWAVQRHDVLRTAFEWQGREAPIQVVREEVTLQFEVRRLERLAAEEQEATLARFLDEDRERGFDLGEAPLSRWTLFVLGPVEHVLVWTFHHAILDGRSFTRVLTELFQKYDGTAPEPGPLPPFSAHCTYLATRDSAPDKKFWVERMRGLSSPTPLPSGSSSFREREGRRRHDEHERRLPLSVLSALEERGREHGFTLANAIQGAWALLLGRHSRTDDVCFGNTRAARHSTVEGATEMVGCLINTIPVRVKIPPDATVASWLSALREDSVAARPHEQASLTDIRAWLGWPSGLSLTPTLVVFERYLMDSQLRALGGRFVHREFEVLEQSDFPLVLAAYEDEESLVLKLEHDPLRWDSDSIERLLSQLETILRAFAQNPESKLSLVPMLDETEKARVLARCGGDGKLVDFGPGTVLDIFDRTAREHAERVAIVAAGTQTTYAELASRVDALASSLIERGLGKGDVVLTCVSRSTELVVALLGTMRAGCIYVPLDPRWPAERLAMIAEDSGAKFALCDEHNAASIPEGVESLRVDVLAAARGTASLPTMSEADPAYVIYTSGSTGKPKGVVVPHEALLAHARAIVPAYGLVVRDRVLQFTSPSFDVSLEEIVPTLLRGATLVLRSEEAASSLVTFVREVESNAVTVLNLPSGFFTEVASHCRDTRASLPKSVRLVVVGGEKPSAMAYATFRTRHPDVRFINAYGPTEVTITSTYCDPVAAGIPADGETELPIGTPLGSTRAYVVDPDGEPTPIGVPGELWLSGPQVALEYLRRPEITASKFARDRHASELRLYRTGDLVRMAPSGALEFLGRVDDQVKVRGFRIELGEIESALRGLPGVRDAAAAVRLDPAGSAFLAGWVLAGTEVEGEALRAELTKRLPSYMVPSTISVLDVFPLTAGGKVDKNALVVSDVRTSRPSQVPPESDLEVWLASIFAEILGRETVGIDESFFELGGHSLTAVRLLSRINTRARDPLALSSIFAKPTIRELARAIELGGTHAVPTLVKLNQADPEALPLFCICGVQLYSKLARAMEAERRVIGTFLPVEADILTQGNAHLDVPQMAAAYIELLREAQPRGPYLLSGISFGGILAYEMAQQLRERGEHVAMLILFDSILPRAIRSPNAYTRAARHLRRLTQNPIEFASHFGARMRIRMTRLSKDPKKHLENASTPELNLVRDELFRRAAIDYDARIEPYDGPVIMFRAQGGLGHQEELVDEDRGWSGLLTPSQTVVREVPGTHVGILEEPGVFEIARSLKTHLSNVDERPPMRRSRRASVRGFRSRTTRSEF